MSENTMFFDDLAEDIQDTETSAKDHTFVQAMLRKIIGGMKRAANLVADYFRKDDAGLKGVDRLYNRATESHSILSLLVLFAIFGLAAYGTTLAAAFIGGLSFLAPVQTWLLAHSVVAGFASTAAAIVLGVFEFVLVVSVATVVTPPSVWVLAKALRLFTVVVKFITNVVTFLAGLVITLVTLLALAVTTVLNYVGVAISTIVTLLHKCFWGLALVLQTPGLAMQSTDALKTEWEAYLHSWKPRNFHVTTMADVILQEQRDQNALMFRVDVTDVPTGKGHPTPKQRVRRSHFHTIVTPAMA